MTHSVAGPEIQGTSPPPFDEIRRRKRKGTIMLAVLASASGVLLIVGAMFWADIAGSGSALSTPAAAEVTTDQAVTGLTDVSDIAARTVDAVVVVEATINAPGPFDTTTSGSGVIVSNDGVIVTNAHVIDNATSITVELTDGSGYAATVLTEDRSADVAVVDIDATGLTAIELGSTADLAVGEPVIAVGNPLALEGGPSVSTGVVSALDRVLDDSDTTLNGIIQTDAAITEGSSGGALLDSGGRLIGMTTAVGVSSVGVEGIAFAIPIETISGVLSSLSSA